MPPAFAAWRPAPFRKFPEQIPTWCH